MRTQNIIRQTSDAERVTITFHDDQEKDEMMRNIPKACSRLVKRTSHGSRRRRSTNDASNPQRDANSTSPVGHRVSSAPLVRRLTPQLPSDHEIDQRRRCTAPALLESDERENDESSCHIEIVSSAEDKVQQWLEKMSIFPQSPVESPEMVSAPPPVLVRSPSEGDDLKTVAAEDKYGVTSCPRIRSYSESDTLRDRKSTRLNSSHSGESRMPSSA